MIDVQRRLDGAVIAGAGECVLLGWASWPGDRDSCGSACLIVAERRKLPNAGSPPLAPVALSSGPGGSSGQ